MINTSNTYDRELAEAKAKRASEIEESMNITTEEATRKRQIRLGKAKLAANTISFKGHETCPMSVYFERSRQ